MHALNADLCTFVRRVAELDGLSDVKVVANSEDCPSRQFMPLTFHRLRLSKEGDVDLEGEFGNAATAGFSAYEKLLRVGKAMRTANSATSIPQAQQANVPSNSRVLAYVLLTHGARWGCSAVVAPLSAPPLLRCSSDRPSAD